LDLLSKNLKPQIYKTAVCYERETGSGTLMV